MPTRRNRSVHAGDAFRRQLDETIDRLVEAFHPEEIILFGSVVEGKPRPESGIDVLIVAKTEARFIDRIKRAVKACEDILPTLAPLVYTPAEVKLLQDQGEGFIQDIFEEGRVLYKKHAHHAARGHAS